MKYSFALSLNILSVFSITSFIFVISGSTPISFKFINILDLVSASVYPDSINNLIVFKLDDNAYNLP